MKSYILIKKCIGPLWKGHFVVFVKANNVKEARIKAGKEWIAQNSYCRRVDNIDYKIIF